MKRSYLKQNNNIVLHLSNDRLEKGTLFPLISIEEEGEHQFCVSCKVSQKTFVI